MRIALHGMGRMGNAVAAVARERGHQIIEQFDEHRTIDPVPLAGIDVVIDFSHATAVDALVDAVCAAHRPAVIGTTGWNENVDALREKCLQAGIGVVWSANFSPGANVMFALARHAGELFARFDGFEAGIEERHHSRKKDAPSGTAIRIATEATQGSGGSFKPPIAASRVGAEFGLHTLFFDSPDDLVEISHRARSRDGFARGAVIAAEKIVGKSGWYSFSELLGL
jgi:4-hydroxy-tetrahydrodipicolinate reductase